jgi:hypothetical protein
VAVEPLRIDGLTGQRFTCFAGPDELPLELCEACCQPRTSTSTTSVCRAETYVVVENVVTQPYVRQGLGTAVLLNALGLARSRG